MTPVAFALATAVWQNVSTVSLLDHLYDYFSTLMALMRHGAFSDMQGN